LEPRNLSQTPLCQSDQEVLKGVREQTSGNEECRVSGASSVGVCCGKEGLSSQSIDSTAIHCEAVENLRGYVLFLEEMDAKYLPEGPLTALREQRARRAIDAAFPEMLQSGSEGG